MPETTIYGHKPIPLSELNTGSMFVFAPASDLNANEPFMITGLVSRAEQDKNKASADYVSLRSGFRFQCPKETKVIEIYKVELRKAP